MELFTLGPGNYTEHDVQESARAHTGYALEEKTGFVFRPRQHDDGQKTFLGETGNFDADAIVDIILRHEAAPKHFARKLFEAFAYPQPDPGRSSRSRASPARAASTRSRSCVRC